MEELSKQIEAQQLKIDAIYVSVEKLRKYFLWTLIITIFTIVAPIVAMIIAVPIMMRTFSGIYGI